MWLLAVFGSVLSTAIADISFNKLLSNTKISTFYSLFAANFFNGLLALGIMIFTSDFNFSYYRGLEIWVILSVLTSIISVSAYIESFRVKSISLSIIIISSSAIISSIGAAIFLGKSMGLSQVLGVIIMLVSITIALFKNIHFEKNHLWAFLAAFALGIWLVIDGYIVSSVSGTNFLFVRSMLSALTIALILPKKFIKETIENKNLLIPISIPQVFYGLYYILTFSAYSFGGNIGIIDSLNNSYLFLLIGWEFFYDGQKEGIIRKIIASLICLMGIILLIS